jgi:hypothetical protein
MKGYNKLGWRNGSSRLEDQGLERYTCYVIFISRALMINFDFAHKKPYVCFVHYQKCLNLALDAKCNDLHLFACCRAS